MLVEGALPTSIHLVTELFIILIKRAFMQATKSQNLCATCTHWDGNRELKSKTVTFDSSDKGKCYHQSGPWKNQVRQASASCNHQETWGPLK